jgi:hypothetical protein
MAGDWAWPSQKEISKQTGDSVYDRCENKHIFHVYLSEKPELS